MDRYVALCWGSGSAGLVTNAEVCVATTGFRALPAWVVSRRLCAVHSLRVGARGNGGSQPLGRVHAGGGRERHCHRARPEPAVCFQCRGEERGVAKVLRRHTRHTHVQARYVSPWFLVSRKAMLTVPFPSCSSCRDPCSGRQHSAHHRCGGGMRVCVAGHSYPLGSCTSGARGYWARAPCVLCGLTRICSPGCAGKAPKGVSPPASFADRQPVPWLVVSSGSL